MFVLNLMVISPALQLMMTIQIRWTSTSTSTSINQLNGLSLGHVDMGESSRKKRKLTTTSPNQQDAYYLELPLESFGKIESNLTTRSPPNQENGLSFGFPTASSTQEDQPAAMQNPNQEDGLSLGFPPASSTQEDQPPAMQNPNQEDGLSLELSLGLPTASSTQEHPPAMQNPDQEDGLSLELSLGLPLSSSTQEDQPAMQNPNQEDVEKDEEVEEQEQQQEEEEEVEQQQQEEEEEVELEQQQEEEEKEVEQEQQQEEEEEEVEQEQEQQQQQQQQQEAPGSAPIPIFIFETRLTSSDVERNHNWLLISGRVNYLMASLMEEERGRVESNGRRDFLRVVTMTTNKYGVEYILHLKRWSGSGALVLKHEWGKLVRANELRIGDSVEGRVYRVDDELRLVLDIIRNHQVH